MWLCSHQLLQPGANSAKSVIVIKKMCLAGAAECQAHLQKKKKKPVRLWRHAAGTHHVTVDLISQNGNAVFGGHWGENKPNCVRLFTGGLTDSFSTKSLFFSGTKVFGKHGRPFRIFCRCSLLKTEPHGLDGLVTIRQEVRSSIRLSRCCRSISQDFSGCRSKHARQQRDTHTRGESFYGDYLLNFNWSTATHGEIPPKRQTLILFALFLGGQSREGTVTQWCLVSHQQVVEFDLDAHGHRQGLI